MKRRVEVVPFDDAWHEQFLEVASQLRSMFGIELLNAYHIGSTSVPGLCAKPIIDILGVVRDITIVDRHTNELEQLGYECMGELGIPGRRYARKRRYEGEEIIDEIHLHFFSYTSESEIERHLAFRDYLCEHSEIAQAYGDLKADLASKYPYDVEAYCDGKDNFVKEVERQALKWYREE